MNWWFLAVVLKQQWHLEFGGAEFGDDGLQVVFALAGDAHGFALDVGAGLGEFVLDDFADLLAGFLVEDFYQLDCLFDGAAGGGFVSLEVQDFWREFAVYNLLDEHVLERLELHGIGNEELDVIIVEGNVGVQALEVVAGLDLALDLIDGVFELHHVELADDVE